MGLAGQGCHSGRHFADGGAHIGRGRADHLPVGVAGEGACDGIPVRERKSGPAGGCSVWRRGPCGCAIRVGDTGSQRTVPPFSRSRIRHCSAPGTHGRSARAPARPVSVWSLSSKLSSSGFRWTGQCGMSSATRSGTTSPYATSRHRSCRSICARESEGLGRVERARSVDRHRRRTRRWLSHYGSGLPPPGWSLAFPRFGVTSPIS